MTNLRSKRLRKPLDPRAHALLSSLAEDAQLVRSDLLGTAAHARALANAGLLDAGQLEAILAEVRSLLQDAPPFDAETEDVHMAVESWLAQRLGDLGQKIHTARSRNDQVALDLRLATRHHLLATALGIHDLIKALAVLAAKAPDAILPGTTHLQPAQPISWAHWANMHIERLLRDLGRTQDAYGRTNTSPLGAAALAGTTHPIDPQVAATLLGFDAAFRNSLDAASDRDFLIETAAVHAQLWTHASQLAEDIIIWASPAYGFVHLDDAFATGSSIMPQKRNPDVFEVVRAAAATAIGELVSLLTSTKGLAAGYNRDLQEQKRVALGAWSRQRQALAALAPAVSTLTPRTAAMAAATEMGMLDATEVADHLVMQGVPFRQAHERAAFLASAAEDQGVAIDALGDQEIHSILGSEAANVRAVLGAAAARDAKTSPGGTAPSSVAAQTKAQTEALADAMAFFVSEANRIAACEDQVLSSRVGAAQ